MADFKKVLQTAQDGYGHRKDYPSFAITPWDDRIKWITYLQTVNDELNAEKGDASG
jgi:hypothetical protein